MRTIQDYPSTAAALSLCVMMMAVLIGSLCVARLQRHRANGLAARRIARAARETEETQMSEVVLAAVLVFIYASVFNRGI